MAEVRITPSSTKSSRKASGNGSDQGVRAGKAHVLSTADEPEHLFYWLWRDGMSEAEQLVPLVLAP